MAVPAGHIVFVGLMGTGKTAVAGILARRLGRSMSDSDRWIRAQTSTSTAALEEATGTAELHRWEARHLIEHLVAPEPMVIASAASVVDDERCLQALRAGGWVVWLTASPQLLAGRTAGTGRPGAAASASYQQQLVERGPRYESVADLTVDTSGRTADDTAAIILRALGPAR